MYESTCIRCEHIILPISSTTIFFVLIKTIWYLPYATIAWLCSEATYNIKAIILCSKSLNPTLHISRPSSVGSALGLKSKGHWFEPAVNHYFSSKNIRLLASRSLQVKKKNYDWSLTNQIGYTGLRQDSYL